MEKCWLLLLVVVYAPSVLTSNLDDDTKWINTGRHMDLSIFIWIIIIIYEHNRDETFWSRKNVDCCFGPLLTPDAPSLTTCNFEDDEKWIYPDRHIVLSFWQRKMFGHWCGPLPTASISWLVVIDPIIFMMRRAYFFCIWIEVKYWWFDRVSGPPDYSYMNNFIEFYHWSQRNHWLLAIWITRNYTCFQ